MFTNLCERFIRSGYREFGVQLFLGFLVSSLCFVHAGGLGVGFFTSWCVQDLGLVVCLSGSRPLGVDRLGHYLLDHWEESTAVHNTTFPSGVWVCFFLGFFLDWKPYMLALAGQSSLHGHEACMIFGLKGHSGEIAG